MNKVNLLLQQQQPIVMGVLNITPDSFSDGGELLINGAPNRDSILARAEQMVNQGVDVFDVGGESTRPNAQSVSQSQQIDRVVPVIDWLVKEFEVPVSVDSSSAQVMEMAVLSGVAMFNDVRAFQQDNALAIAAQSNLPVCLMHMQGEPDVMQVNPEYSDVIDAVKLFFQQRIAACKKAGVKPANIIIDPGFGFGKTLKDNLVLFRGLPELSGLGYPLLVGVSRKSMLGEILNKPVNDRLHGSVTAAVMAVQRGAQIVRVHDVGATVDALRIMQAIEGDYKTNG